MTSKIILGDCMDIMPTMENESIDTIITSPPYWNQKEYAHWPTYQEYLNDVQLWVQQAERLLKPGRHCFWIIPDKLPWTPKMSGLTERLYFPIYSDTERIASDSGLVCKFPIIWAKKHGTQRMFGSYPYPPTTIHTPTTERICIWRKPGQPDLSRKTPQSAYTKEQWSRWATDIWTIPPTSNPKHPAPFPIAIPLRILTLWTFPNDTILDPFIGSGTTANACNRLQRNCIGIEKYEPYYNYASLHTSQLTLRL